MAAILTTVSFLPQVIKVWKSRKTRDTSLGMFIILSIGIVLWLVYGFYIKSLPVIIANTVTFILTWMTIVAKLKYK